MAVSTTVSITGGEKAKKMLANAVKDAAKDKMVSVGFFKNATYPDKKGTPVAAVAAWNEFGTKSEDGSQHIPERPFFRNAIKNSEGDITQLVKKGYNSKTMKVHPSLMEVIGVKMQSNLQKSMVDLKEPPNSP